jgi:hypothetical protein
MLRPFRQLLTVVSILCAFQVAFDLAVHPARADGPIHIISQSTESKYGQSITFNLHASSASGKITNVEFYMQWVGNYPKPVAFINTFTPASEVNLQYVYNKFNEDLLPYSQVIYHWSLTDDAGNTFSTKSTSADYTDSTRPWQMLTDGKVSVYWYDRDHQYGKDLLDAVRPAYDRAIHFLNYRDAEPLRFLIFNTLDDYCTVWGTLACPRKFLEVNPVYSGWAIGSVWLPDDKFSIQDNLISGVGFAVEINIIRKNIFRNATTLPAWFFASIGQNIALDGPNPYLAHARELAAQNKLLRFSDLEQTLRGGLEGVTHDGIYNFGPDDRDDFEDVAAETNSIVPFLIERFGKESVEKILVKARSAATFADALQDVTRLSMDEFEAAWRTWLGATGPLPTLVPTPTLDVQFPPSPVPSS